MNKTVQRNCKPKPNHCVMLQIARLGTKISYTEHLYIPRTAYDCLHGIRKSQALRMNAFRDEDILHGASGRPSPPSTDKQHRVLRDADVDADVCGGTRGTDLEGYAECLPMHNKI